MSGRAYSTGQLQASAVRAYVGLVAEVGHGSSVRRVWVRPRTWWVRGRLVGAGCPRGSSEVGADVLVGQVEDLLGGGGVASLGVRG